MKVEIKAIIFDKTIVTKFIEFTGEFPEEMPVEGQQYIVYFEKVEDDPVPEFNT
jgi:hypothetical protein